MKFIKLLIITLSLLVFEPSSGWTTAQEQQSLNVALSWQEVLNYARDNLPLEGQLLMKSDGFGYIKVDDEYIHTLFPMLGLAEEGFKKPPYFRSADSPGAHISIFYVDENIFPEEIGQTFHFALKDIVIVRPSQKTSYAVLQVEAPELEKLREKYGLSPKLHGHEYHISIAKKTTFPSR